VNNCGQFSLLVQLGGSYNFTHCTFANFWTNSFRGTPAVFLDNTLATTEALLVGDLTEANFINCLIDGNQNEEIGFNNEPLGAFNFRYTNSLIRFEDKFEGIPEFDFTNTSLYENIILNQDSDFDSPENNRLRVGEATAGNGMGLLSGALAFPNDIIGVDRTNSPDLGAYQSIELPE
jgi:hypothetical protein